MSCKLRYRRYTDGQLREAQISTGLALDRAHESTLACRGLMRYNARKRYHRIMDEMDRRKRKEQ
jgi:hypothetical protein